MANPFIALLQDFGANPLVSTGQPLDTGDINVVGRKAAPVFEDDPAPISLGNRSQIEEAQQAQKNAPKRKGMFGAKGTLRDILGALGDHYLMSKGQKPAYRELRQQEKVSDAMTGFTQNPLAALERLANTPGGAELAKELYDNIGQNQARMTTANATSSNQRFDNSLKFGQMLGGLLGSAQDEGAYKIAYGIAQRRAKAAGLDLEDFGVSDVYDPNAVKALREGGMTAYQKETNEIRRETEGGRNTRHGQTEDRKERQYTPPQPRSAPQPTATSLAQPLLDKIERGEKLTKGQEEKLRRLGMSPERGMTASEKRRAARAARNGAAPSGGKLVFRNGKLVPKE